MSTKASPACSGLSAQGIPSWNAGEGEFPIRGTIAALFLSAVLLYAPLIGWGIPNANTPERTRTVATDEILPLEGLAEMHNTFVVSKPDRNYGYPWFHYFVTAAAQAPYLLYAKLSGALGSPSPDFPYGFRDPVTALRWLTFFGRAVSVLMGAGIVIAGFLFARNLWGYRVGLLAGILVLLDYQMTYYSRTDNLDVPVTFWTSIGLVIFTVILEKGFTVRRGMWLGMIAGIAMATKDQAALVFFCLGIYLLFASRGHSWRPPVVALAVSIAAYIAATGMLIDPHRHIEHVYRLVFKPDSLNSMGFYRPGHPKTWQGTVQVLVDFLQGMTWSLSLPLVLMALAGIFATARSAPRRLIFLLPVPLFFLGLALPIRTVVLRYFLPLTIIFCGFAAYGVFQLSRSRLRRLTIPVIAILCGWELAVAADLSYAQYRETRLATAAWLQVHGHNGDRLEYFGVREAIPPLPADIISRRIAGRTEWKRESGHGPRILQYLAAEGPEFVFIAPDVTSKPGIPYSGDCPPDVYEALLHRKTNYTEVAHFETPTLLPSWFSRPLLDYPTVAPPVHLFARNDILVRFEGRP